MTRVLLVEDDEMIIRMYKKTLELEGYDVDTADNGLSALEQLAPVKPDIILLDIMMPTMNGVEFLKKMTAGTAENQTPVIVLTNVADENVKTEAAANGASLVLIKSQTEPDDVVASIKQVLSGDILQTGESLEGEDEENSKSE